MQLLLQTIVCIYFFVTSQTAYSQEAHVHGVVTLTLAAEGHELLLELQSPAANLLGFEHKPKTAKQQVAVKKLLEQLENPENLWQLAGANCELSSVDVDSDLLVANKEVSDKHHDEEHKHHDEYKHHHHHDIHVSYIYQCKSLRKLTGFKTQLFSQYSSIEKIDLQWLITHNKNKPQGAATLTQQKSTITF